MLRSHVHLLLERLILAFNAEESSLHDSEGLN